jgi:tetratricopeptide (TPR) repeat protein
LAIIQLLKNNLKQRLLVALLLPLLSLGQPSANSGNSLSFDSAFWQAQEYKISGRQEQALKSFLQCDSIEPDNALIKIEIAKIYAEKQSIGEALEYASKGWELDSKVKWYGFLYTDLLLADGKLLEATQVLEQISDLEPGSADPLFALTGVYLDLGKWPEALRALSKIEALRGIDKEVSRQKVKIYLYQDGLELALVEMDKLITAFPYDFEIQLQKADLYSANDRQLEAVGIWKNIISKSPNQPTANLRLARWHQSIKEYDKSYTYLKAAAASPSLDIDEKIGLLLSFYEQTERDSTLLSKAYELLDIVVQSSPNSAKAFAMKGDFLARDLRLLEAREAYLKAVSLPEGTKYEIWQQILLIDAELNKLEWLEADSKQAVDLFPTQPLPYVYKGITSLNQGDEEQAIEWLEAGLDLSFANRALQERFSFFLAEAEYTNSNVDQAFKYFEKALDINPNNPTTLNNYAYYLALANRDLAKALKMSEKSNSLQPQEPNFIDTWAWVLFQQGNYTAALEKINEALSLSEPKPAGFHEHKGDILFRMNKVEEALIEWEKAVALGSNNSVLLKKIEKKKWYAN